MKKLTLALGTLVFAGSAFANSYQSVSNLSYAHQDGENLYSIDSSYYFAPKRTLGPLNEFDYINTTNRVFGRVTDSDAGQAYSVGGDAFLGELMFGGDYHYADMDGGNADAYSLRAGYLLGKDLLLKVTYLDNDHSENFLFSADYTYHLSGKDYIGFNATLDDGLDHRAVSAKYFTELGQGRYLSVSGSIEDGEGWNNWTLASSYYFTPEASMFVSYERDDDYSLGGRYYFNDNIALGGGYANNLDDSSQNRVFATLTAQF